MNRGEIAKAHSVSEFLSTIIVDYKGRSLSYSDLGRLCGLKSRSHPREIVLGKKKVSLETAGQIVRGLKLTADLGKLFLLLAEYELARDARSKAYLEKQIDKARSEVMRQVQRNRNDSEKFFSLADVSLVYAALGDEEKGSSLGDVCRKTRLPRTRVNSVLMKLTNSKFACQQGDRFLATERHLSFAHLKAGEAFQTYYLSRLKLALKKATQDFESKDELFWEATMSLNTRDLNRLKEDLRQLLSRYAEEAESAGGESLRSITVGFFDPRS